jgi:hypothetical protein
MLTLTFNQWVTVFVTGVVIILVFAWIAALVIDKKHREDSGDPRSRIYPFNKENEPFVVSREMYNIWVGRILEIVSGIRGSETGKIDGEHGLSVWLWILTLGAIAGYFLTWFSWDFLCLVIVGMFGGTFLYAHWRHDEPFVENP